jgi:hypothetical protein
MASAHEVALGFAWMMSVLSGDSTFVSQASGGIWRAKVPAEASPPLGSPPYCVLIYQTGSDTMRFGGRAYSGMLFQARMVGPALSSAALETAAARMDTLLTLTAETAVTGGTIKSCYRSQPLQLDELVEGVEWTNIGGLYRMVAKSA